MHPYWLIPLLTIIASSVVGAGSLSRDREYRPNFVIAAVMWCTAAWALIEIAYSVQSDADVALRWIRLLGFAYLPLAPLVLELLARLGRLDEAAWHRMRPSLAGLVALLVVGHAATPWFVAAAHPAPYGWRYEFGPAFWPGLLLTVGVCAAAALHMMRTGEDAPMPPSVRAERLRHFGAIIFVPIVLACVTDVALPALAIDGPRLGALAIVLSAGTMWLGLFAGAAPDPASGTLARQFLDELHDGVAILRIDGTLRAANERFARIVGRDHESLIGCPDTLWLGERSAIRDGHLRELELKTPEGIVPVALWQKDILDRQGSPIGRVAILRDQRTLVELRRRIVTAGQMSALGALAAGIAHEVNNPIAWVLSNLNQLRRQCDELTKDPRAGACAELADTAPEIDACLDALARVVEFVAEVRSFADPSGGSPVLYQVESLVEGALRLAEPCLRDLHTISLEKSSPPELRCLPQELKHAFLSVLLSVGQELPAPGRITLRTSFGDDAVHVDVETDGPLGDTLESGAELLLGGGGARSGGLLVPRQRVRQQGGRLEVAATASGGTLLRISLPRTSPSEGHGTSAAEHETDAGSSAASALGGAA